MDPSFDDVWAECEDLFVQARQRLAALKSPQPPHVVQASVNALFRTTHTLKGMAGMLGFPRFSQAAHRMEDIFDLMRQGRLRSTDSLIETLEAGIQALESGLTELRRGRPEPEDYLHAIRRQLGELEALARPSEGAVLDLTALLDLPPDILKALSEYERTRVTAVLLAGIPIQGVSVRLDLATFDERLRSISEAAGAQGELISTLPLEMHDDRDGLFFLLLVATPALEAEGLGILPEENLEIMGLADPERVPASLKADPGLLVAPPPGPMLAASHPPAALPQDAEVLRLPAQRVDALEARLMTVAQVRDSASLALREIQNPGLTRPMAMMGEIEAGLLEVQKALLQMRMVKVESLFQRIEPMVKTLSRDMGKPVRLSFQGGELELERSLLGRLTEPFLHLVRNALDHGLESPEERAAQGKAETGFLKISASQRGRNLRFDLRDDGRGFDLARIEARGIAMGLLKEGQVHSAEDLHRLALEPGFSTKERASQISGRGVGMDVVRAEVEGMGGDIQISSEPRRGSLVRLSLPLSRAVIACLKVRCGQQTFGVPLNHVLRVQSSLAPVHGGGRIEVLGRDLPMESLQACLGLPGPAGGQQLFVVLRQQGAAAETGLDLALGVDEVAGRVELLLRSLPELAHAPGIMGGSLQEDGVLWVLDPEAVMGLAMDSLMKRVADV